MPRVYLIPGLVVQPFLQVGPAVGAISGQVDADYYRDIGMSLPTNYPLVRFGSLSASLAVCFWNVGHGVFAVRAAKRSTAYSIGNALWGYATLAHGYEPALDDFQPLLYELPRYPQPSWSDEQLIEELDKANLEAGESALHQLSSGPAIDHRNVILFRDRLPRLLANPALHEALVHVRVSRQLFHGHMVGSYYQLHYSRDRRRVHWREIERLYYEHRARFELAFVSAFKAIERLLGPGHFRAHEVRGLLRTATFLGVAPSTRYRRFHEIFRGLRKHVTVEDMIKHLLRLRNAVAAHANSSPPRHLMLSEDNIYEIQNFVAFLIGEAIRSAEPVARTVTYAPRVVRRAT